MRIHEISRQGAQKYPGIATKIITGLLDQKIGDHQFAHENDQSQITALRSVCSQCPAPLVTAVKLTGLWTALKCHQLGV